MRRDGVRLLTLTGAGGSGKTRIALQAGAELLDAYADGVFSVSLATVTDPALVLPAIAEALGLNEGAGQSLAAYLAPRRLLLVIDNVEHVVLRRSRPRRTCWPALAGLRLLLTSREPMRLAGEQVMPIEPMAAEDAVSLFITRATAVLPKLRRSPTTTAGRSARSARVWMGCRWRSSWPRLESTCSHPTAMLDRLSDRPQAADRRRARPACAASDDARHARLEPRAPDR